MVKESWLSSLSTTYYWGVTETQSFLVVNPNAVTFTPTPVTPVAVTTTPTPTSSPTPTLTQTPTSTPTFTSTPTASSSPTATFTATTTPVVNNQISWKTDQTTLEADNFYMVINGVTYTNSGSEWMGLYTNTPTYDSIILSVYWGSANTSIKIVVYFSALYLGESGNCMSPRLRLIMDV